ncbi:T9SS type B sorting domain-containing protein [Flavobacterium sp.]|uniref:T9SS type B sorting domain-containing protein n=1 Tax=Flavobacterium sp. TaxID=239 RepID=UPI0025BAC1DF|nr:T9SS type B sorting domain-containing protein [Flavobacterium sp.]
MKTLFCLLVFSSIFTTDANAQVYRHEFGTTAINAHPYTAAPNAIDTNLSTSGWSNSTGVWTSAAGNAGQAIRLTSTGSATITLALNVAPNYALNVTSFDFWRMRSNTGATNFTLAINGTPIGAGTIGTTGAALGNTPVSNTASGFTGAVTVTLTVTGATGGTFRLDDFTLYGSVVTTCTGSTVTSIFPTTGPEHTLVNISGNGFQSGSGTTSVTFNGVAAAFTVISNMLIQAYVPAGNATGLIGVVTNACPAFSIQPFTEIVSVALPNYSTDIYISEVYDAQAGDGGVIEIYNGTNATVNLSNYSIRRYGDVGGSTFYEFNLVGTLAPGGIHLVGIGVGTAPCSIVEGTHYDTGFNADDDLQLLKNGSIIDDVHAPNNVGFSILRNPDAIAPKVIFDAADWTINDTESCTDIGQFSPPLAQLPASPQPASVVICENGSASFSAIVPNPAIYTYQWKMLNSAGAWVNVPNAAPYSGANTATLTITSTPVSLDNSQFYCAIGINGSVAVSNAAQLEVNPGLAPDFPTTATICSGDTAPILATTSPNGVTGTWSPAVVSNTASGTYIFTPGGSCGVPFVFTVTVTTPIVPNFASSATICQNMAGPSLSTTSPNGITGTWSPSVMDNQNSGTYVFTPTAGQCATQATLVVTITPNVVPNFATTLTLCQGSTAPVLATTSSNGISGIWNPSTINNAASGNYIFTPNLGQCATSVTLAVTVTNSIVPDFASTLTLCTGSVATTLATTSPNGITGTWNPSSINNTANGSYVFTPNSGQCAVPFTLAVTVTNTIVPNFATTLTLCQGSTAPVLATTSPNGIVGTWNPAAINNTTSGSYVFTPNPNQCATPITLAVTVTNSIVPDFATTLTLCQNSVAPVLATTSPNGISGTWNPSVINNQTSANYIFTPTSGQCATLITLAVSVTNQIVPNFATTLTLCNGATAPALATTSPNGISGTWSPTTINNTSTASYIFTPTSGQCATSVTLVVTVTNTIVPNFATTLTLCQGTTAPVLATTSPNGIVGTWNPAAINNTTSSSYVFTPNPNQCATPITLAVTVTNSIVPDFGTTLTLCQNSVAPVLATTSPNGISGTWNPSVINNQTSANYIFTPTSGQCATPLTLAVSVTNQIVPNFATTLTLCNGATAPALATTSPNGISGTWSPTTINNTSTASYIFTPTSGQCATSVTLVVTVTNTIVPSFATTLTLCQGTTAPVLATTSPNGIVGTWNPATISNTTSGNYVFTPNPNQCATPITLAVTVTNSIVPDFATTLTLCQNSTAPVLATTSPNGISGTWNPSVINNQISANYIFTPTSGQCASQVTLAVTVNALPNPRINDGAICLDDAGQPITTHLLSTGLPNSGYTFVWTLNGAPLPTTTNAHTATEAGTYEVTVTNAATGCSNSDQATVTATSGITVNANTPADFTGGIVTIQVSGGSGNYTFTLDGEIAQTTGVFYGLQSGEHTIFVQDVNGCDSETVTIFLLNYPKFFTPNGDGYHDIWNISGLDDQPDARIHIFDRYGKLLKTLQPSSTTGWDGTYNGHSLLATDYWFLLEYRDRVGTRKEFKAHFSLKR